jgi:hypothetical protein
VLFGSGTGAGFVLDTVFVLDDAVPTRYELGETGVLAGNTVADAVVFGPLATTDDGGRECTAYRGRMHDHGADGPYSFVPCRPEDADVRFARPLLEPDGELADLVEPKLFMGTRVVELSETRLAAVWQHVFDVCSGQGLAQGGAGRPTSHDPVAGPWPAGVSGHLEQLPQEPPRQLHVMAPLTLFRPYPCAAALGRVTQWRCGPNRR